MSKDNEFATIGVLGLDSPFIQFTKGGLETLSMELFFDSYEEGSDVRDYTKKITNLLEINSETHAPPVLKFIWSDARFTCVLKSVSKKFTMFRPDGIPVRATLNVTFQEYREATRTRETPQHSSDKTKIYTVKEGDSLWSIAAFSYGDPGLWRPIADANRIENPRVVEAGTIIKIPPLDG